MPNYQRVPIFLAPDRDDTVAVTAPTTVGHVLTVTSVSPLAIAWQASGGGGSADHAALSHLAWGVSGHTKGTTTGAVTHVAGWASGGSATAAELGTDITAASVGADASGTAAAAVASHVAASDPHTQYQKESEKGANNGYCGLDSSGLVDPSDLPSATKTTQGAVQRSTYGDAVTDAASRAKYLSFANLMAKVTEVRRGLRAGGYGAALPAAGTGTAAWAMQGVCSLFTNTAAASSPQANRVNADGVSAGSGSMIDCGILNMYVLTSTARGCIFTGNSTLLWLNQATTFGTDLDYMYKHTVSVYRVWNYNDENTQVGVGYASSLTNLAITKTSTTVARLVVTKEAGGQTFRLCLCDGSTLQSYDFTTAKLISPFVNAPTTDGGSKVIVIESWAYRTGGNATVKARAHILDGASGALIESSSVLTHTGATLIGLQSWGMAARTTTTPTGSEQVGFGIHEIIDLGRYPAESEFAE